MKKEHRSRIVAFLLPILMIFQAFVFTNVSKAEEEKKSGENYTINIQLPMNDAYSVPKDTDILRSSGRQVIYWNITGKDEITKDNLYQKIKEYEKMDNAKITEKFGEGQLSDFSKLVYSVGDKDYEASEVDLSELSEEEKNAFEFKREIITIPNLEEGTYLIKESDSSIENAKSNGNDAKLFASIQTLSKENDNIKEGILSINIKTQTTEPDKDIVIEKVDYYNPDIKLDKVEFKLFRRDYIKENAENNFAEKFKDVPINVEKKGEYYWYIESPEGLTEDKVNVLATNTEGKITVKGLPSANGEEYVFKEVKPIKGYDILENINKITEETIKPGDKEVQITNKRIPFLKKIDSETKKPLNGVKFGVYNVKGEQLKFTWDEKKDAYIYDQEKGKTDLETKGQGYVNIVGMEEGEGYYFKETTALENYIKDESDYKFDVDKDGKILVKTDNEKEKVNESIVVENKPKNPGTEEKVGGYRFIKVDKDDHKIKLSGAKFEVLKKVGDNLEPIKKGGYYVTSGANGEVVVENLPYEDGGTTYYLMESSAPLNYIPETKAIPFKVDGKSSLKNPVLIENKKGVTPTTPGGSTSTRGPKGPLVKTGDIRILVFFAAGLLLILGGYKMVRSQDKKVNRA